MAVREAIQHSSRTTLGGRIIAVLPKVIVGIGLVVLGVTAFLLVGHSTESFPTLAPGTYLARIQWISSDLKLPQLWFLERASGDDHLLIQAIDQSLPPSRLSVPAAAEQLPLVVPVAGVDRIRLVGTVGTNHQIQGTAEVIGRSVTGRWQLQPMLEQQSEKSDLLWLMLESERIAAEQQITTAIALRESQQREIASLNEAISNRDELRAQVDQRYKESKSQLDQIKEDLSKQESVVADLAQKMDLLQKTTPQGRLVALSRESLDRERRWFESVSGQRDELLPAMTPAAEASAESEKIESEQPADSIDNATQPPSDAKAIEDYWNSR